MDAALTSLIRAAVEDGMVLRRVTLPAAEVIFLKSILEAYPGYGAVLAEPRHSAAKGSRRPAGKREVTIVAAPGFERDLDELLAEVTAGCGRVLPFASATTTAGDGAHR